MGLGLGCGFSCFLCLACLILCYFVRDTLRWDTDRRDSGFEELKKHGACGGQSTEWNCLVQLWVLAVWEEGFGVFGAEGAGVRGLCMFFAQLFWSRLFQVDGSA